jgi:hypothetical protein
VFPKPSVRPPGNSLNVHDPTSAISVSANQLQLPKRSPDLCPESGTIVQDGDRSKDTND